MVANRAPYVYVFLGLRPNNRSRSTQAVGLMETARQGLPRRDRIIVQTQRYLHPAAADRQAFPQMNSLSCRRFTFWAQPFQAAMKIVQFRFQFP
jgi:hypothetical protein